MFNMFRNGFDYQPPGDLFRMRQYQPTTGGIMPPQQRFNPMTGGNHPPMQAPQFNTGGSLQPQQYAPMAGVQLPAYPSQMGGLAGLFRRGMY